MPHVLFHFRCLLLITFLFVCAGCVSGPQVRERYFWPPPPDTPRIEWIGAYQGAADLKTQGLMELVVGTEEAITLAKPVFITADGNGKVYVSDFTLKTVVVFDMQTKDVHALGSGVFEHPTGLAVDGQGNVYVGDTKTRKILVFDRNERPLNVIDLSGNLQSIGSIAIDKSRNRMLVPDVKDNKVLVYDLASRMVLFSFGGSGVVEKGTETDSFNFPTAVTVDSVGNILVCDSMNARIVRFTPDGKFISRFGRRGDGVGDFNMIKAVAVDSEGHIYVTDSKANRISIYNEKGEVLLLFGGAYSLKGPGSQVTPGGFLLPNGIYIDQNDRIYIADQYNSRFQVFQYVTEQYLREHPITEQMPAAKADIPQKSKFPVDGGAK